MTDIMLNAAELLTAAGVITGVILAVVKWFLKQNDQSEEIESLKKKHDEDMGAVKEEQYVMTYGILACLKGLAEQGCDGPVHEAIVMMENHLNQRAHR